MHLDDNPDYMTIWKLAHNWANVDPNESDESSISLEIKKHIHRLLEASYKMEISVRTHRRRIFIDESYISLIADFIHTIKFMVYLRGDKLSKIYLNSLYVHRNEVLNWCINIAHLDPPPCWALKSISTTERTLAEIEDPDDENNSWYDKITERRRERVVCIELAKQLWQKYPGLTYEEMYDHVSMRELGYSTKFNFKNFKKLVRPVASEPAKMPGAPTKSKG